MTELVSEVLAAAAAAEATLASTKVEKPIELELDLGNMLATDNNVIDNSAVTDRYLDKITNNTDTHLPVSIFLDL